MGSRQEPAEIPDALARADALEVLRHRAGQPTEPYPLFQEGSHRTLTREYGCEYYGGKHFESRLTQWFQSVYLPRKFGYDKRRYHLSCLINNGEMPRGEALAQLTRPPCAPEPICEGEAYILKSSTSHRLNGIR
jgi:hypothetical protein